MFTAYLRERFPLRIFGVAAIGIVTAARWTSGATPTVATLAHATALSIVLLLQFRMWDDLEDRDQDSTSHQERVLVRTPAAPYQRALRCLALVSVALGAFDGWSTAVEIVLLDLGFYMAYRRVRQHVSDGVWRFSILLSKYPAFVVVVATVLGAPQAGRLAAAVLVTYLTACAYELLHERRLFAGVPS